MEKQNKIIDNLIETLKDGQEGFKQAAEGVADPQLKSLFNEYSQQRSRFANELQNQAEMPVNRNPKIAAAPQEHCIAHGST